MLNGSTDHSTAATTSGKIITKNLGVRNNKKNKNILFNAKEVLISAREVALMLDISVSQFYRKKNKLKAYGLKSVVIGKKPKYRLQSVEEAIKNMCDKEATI